MAPNLKERVGARNRRQRTHASELRRDSRLRQYVQRFRATQKIESSRARLGRQVVRSRRMALRAKRKAIQAQERARR
jgi:hypothetical protein